MAEITVKLLVNGGKANAGPPLGPALAPHKLNIQEVVTAINNATKDMQGIQIPVEVIADTETKKFKIKVGTPSVSAMIKKELGLEKLAKAPFGTYTPKEGETVQEFNGNLTMDQIIKIARLKKDVLGSDFKKCVKQVVGSCVSNGCTVNSEHPREIQKKIDAGEFDDILKE